LCESVPLTRISSALDFLTTSRFTDPVKTVGCLPSADNDAPVTPTDTKVSTDTIVQLFRLRASGLIASVQRIGSIEDRDNFAKENSLIFEKQLYTAKVHAAGRETILRALCGWY